MKATPEDWMRDRLNYELGDSHERASPDYLQKLSMGAAKAWGVVSAIIKKRNPPKPYIEQIRSGIHNVNYRLTQTSDEPERPSEPVFIAPRGRFENPHR